MKKSGKYHILVAEIFTDRETLLATLKNVRKRYKGAYATDINPENAVLKTTSPKEPVITRQETKNVEVKSAPKEKVTELISYEYIDRILPKVEVNVVEEKEVSTKNNILNMLDKYFHLYYIIFFILFLIVSYYYFKLKDFYNAR